MRGRRGVTRDQFAEVFGGSQSAAAAVAQQPAVEEQAGAPDGFPASVGEDEGGATTTAPVEEPASGEPPITASSTPDAPDESEETPPDVAPDMSPPVSAVEAPAEAANDNEPPAQLPATGTE